MKKYHYIGLTQENNKLDGFIDAASKVEAAKMLMQKGISPIQIRFKLKRTSMGDVLSRVVPSYGISEDEKILFFSQLYSISRSNVSILDGLKSLSNMHKNKMFNQVVNNIVVSLESGFTLTESFSNYENIFGRFCISLIAMGEKSGNLTHAFQQIKQYLDEEKNTRRKIWLAFRYPILVTLFALMAICIINIFVIPMFKQFFESFSAELPWPTKILMTTSDFFLLYGTHVGALIIALMGVLLWSANTPSGKLYLDRKKLRLPFIGSILKKQMISRFSNQLSHALQADVPMLMAIQVLSDVTNNRYFEEEIRKICMRIERGESFSHASKSCSLFSPLMLQMISVGERSGELPHVLTEIGEYYQQENDFTLRLLNQRVEPFLITLVALLVLILALGVFMPMWDISSVAISN